MTATVAAPVIEDLQQLALFTGLQPVAIDPASPINLRLDWRDGLGAHVLIEQRDRQQFANREDLIARTCSLIGEVMMLHRGVNVLHAAAFVPPQRRDGGAVLLMGPSYAGKSTLTQLAARAGAAVVGDDFAVLDDQGAAPFPKPLKLRGWHTLTADHLHAVMDDEPVTLIARAGPGLVPLDQTRPVAGIVSLRRHDGARTTLEPVPLPIISAELLSQTRYFPSRPLDIVRSAHHWLTSRPRFQLTIGAGDSAAALEQLLTAFR